MPSPRLILRESDRHGTCLGLTPHAYFEAMRKAREAAKIPAGYLASTEPLPITPEDVAAAFVKANPGFSRSGLAVACDATHRSASVHVEGFHLPRLRRRCGPPLKA